MQALRGAATFIHRQGVNGLLSVGDSKLVSRVQALPISIQGVDIDETDFRKIVAARSDISTAFGAADKTRSQLISNIETIDAVASTVGTVSGIGAVGIQIGRIVAKQGIKAGVKALAKVYIEQKIGEVVNGGVNYLLQVGAELAGISNENLKIGLLAWQAYRLKKQADKAGPEKEPEAPKKPEAVKPESSAPKGFCFLAGTLVSIENAEIGIEELKVGDRVLTSDGNEIDAKDSGERRVDEITWKHIYLKMLNPDGSGDTIDVEVLRSPEWLTAVGCKVGGKIQFALPEMGLLGQAVVQRIEACPKIGMGKGRVVLATVTHLNGYVLELRLVGQDKPIELTNTHRLYSESRGTWIPAAELKAGESLRTRTGSREIYSIQPKPGIYRVFNIEVETKHCFYVSKAEILSHNENPCAAPVPPRDSAQKLQAAATEASKTIGPGKGPAHGTNVHTEFEQKVNSLGDSNLHTEVSYKNGVEVPRGTEGSVRLDVVEGPRNAPEAVFDLKTGKAKLSSARVEQIQANLPGGDSVPVTEVRP